MFAVRFIALAFVCAYGWEMGQPSPLGLNSFGKFMAFSFFLSAPALYLLPTYEAWNNKHKNLASIAMTNVFLGWSLIGWVAAAVWAFKKPESVVISSPAAANNPVVEATARETRKCPFCAEEILAEAKKCKHCGSAIEAVAPVGAYAVPTEPGRNF